MVDADWTPEDAERLEALLAATDVRLPMGLSKEETERQRSILFMETISRLLAEGDPWADRLRDTLNTRVHPLLQAFLPAHPTEEDLERFRSSLGRLLDLKYGPRPPEDRAED